MDDHSLDIAAYARRIGYSGACTATRGCLAELVARHLQAIPFENIDVLAGRVPALDTRALEAKLVRGGRGGWCFEQNGLLLAVLRQCGFDVHAREARVRLGVPAQVATGRTHMALQVRLDGAPWLVDAGFPRAPRRPLRLDIPQPQDDGVDTFRLVDDDEGVRLQELTHEGWTDCYLLLPSQPREIDREIGNWFVATHPESMLRRNLLLARAHAEGRSVLFNHRLTTSRCDAQAPDVRELATRAEVDDALARHFGLRLEPPHLDAVMAALEQAG